MSNFLISGFLHDFKNREKFGIVIKNILDKEKLGKACVSSEKLGKLIT